MLCNVMLEFPFPVVLTGAQNNIRLMERMTQVCLRGAFNAEDESVIGQPKQHVDKVLNYPSKTFPTLLVRRQVKLSSS